MAVLQSVVFYTDLSDTRIEVWRWENEQQTTLTVEQVIAEAISHHPNLAGCAVVAAFAEDSRARRRRGRSAVRGGQHVPRLDPERQRREYLKHKRRAYVRMLTNVGFRIPVLLLIIACMAWLLYIFLTVVSGVIPKLIGGIVFGLAIVGGCRELVRNAREIRALKKSVALRPYIPPVIPNDLPAEEVLVRGSEPPAVEQREILVRPATSREETETEQLLRSSQEQHP